MIAVGALSSSIRFGVQEYSVQIREMFLRFCSVPVTMHKVWVSAINTGCWNGRRKSRRVPPANHDVALDRAGITVFRGITFLAAGPASERSRSAAWFSKV